MNKHELLYKLFDRISRYLITNNSNFHIKLFDDYIGVCLAFNSKFSFIQWYKGEIMHYAIEHFLLGEYSTTKNFLYHPLNRSFFEYVIRIQRYFECTTTSLANDPAYHLTKYIGSPKSLEELAIKLDLLGV